MCRMEKMAISTQRSTEGMPTLTSTYDTCGPVVISGLEPDEKKEMTSYIVRVCTKIYGCLTFCQNEKKMTSLMQQILRKG